MTVTIENQSLPTIGMEPLDYLSNIKQAHKEFLYDEVDSSVRKVEYNMKSVNIKLINNNKQEYEEHDSTLIAYLKQLLKDNVPPHVLPFKRVEKRTREAL